MENRILKIIQKYNMIEPNDTVLVALSGGADSVLLAEFLLKYREKLKIKLVCAHVEHGIRGEESLRDFEFVKHWCEKAGVDFKYIHINAPKEASACKMGVEEYSRKKRYEFFETIKCDKIATAHNKSDNIETVLFRMARGTFLNGACGIPAVRGKIIRPLIELTSVEIRKYCKDNNIEYVTDSTNLSNDYSRNFIRNVVVNNLKQINPEFENSFSNLIEDIKLEENFSNEYAKSVLDRALSEDEKLKKSVLKNETTYINRKVIVEYSLLFGIKLDRNHLLSVEKLINFNSKSDINERYCFVSNNDFIRIVDKKMHFSLPDYEQTIISYEEFVKNSDYYKKQFDFFCDYDKINAKVFVRKRMDGDKIFLKDRKCSKTLKKLFNENKIPPEIRSVVPIICDGDLIIGVGNFAVSEYVKITQKTKSVLLIKFTEVKNE